MTRTADTDRICKDAWVRALYCFATAKIFFRRARRYRNGLQALSVLGVAIPVTVGGIVIAFGTAPAYLPAVLIVAAVLGIVQLVLSTFALGYGWADALDYANESAVNNFSLSDDYCRLGKTCENPSADLASRFEVVAARDEGRRAQDAKKSITDREMRRGHREGLRQFQSACAACGEIPTSMKSTMCDVCGRF